MLIDYLKNFTIINNPNGFLVLLIVAAIALYFAGKEDN